MPLKVDASFDTGLDLNKEPLYDETKLEAYCEEHHKTREELSEEEKRQFVVGILEFHFE